MSYPIWDPVCGHVSLICLQDAPHHANAVLKPRNFATESGNPVTPDDLLRCGSCRRIIQMAPNQLGRLVVRP